MSSNKALISFVAALWTVIGAYYFIANKNDNLTDNGHKHNHGKMTAKLSAGIDVEFKMSTKSPKPNIPIQVNAEVTSLIGEGVFEYKLFMPQQTELLNLPAEGQIELGNSQAKNLNIAFTQSADYDMKIHLEIRRPGSANSSMFTFSTLDFHKNKQEVEALQERKSDYSK